MQARAERTEDVRVASHAKAPEAKKFLASLRERPRLASPEMPARKAKPPRKLVKV